MTDDKWIDDRQQIDRLMVDRYDRWQIDMAEMVDRWIDMTKG